MAGVDENAPWLRAAWDGIPRAELPAWMPRRDGPSSGHNDYLVPVWVLDALCGIPCGWPESIRRLDRCIREGRVTVEVLRDTHGALGEEGVKALVATVCEQRYGP